MSAKLSPVYVNLSYSPRDYQQLFQLADQQVGGIFQTKGSDNILTRQELTGFIENLNAQPGGLSRSDVRMMNVAESLQSQFHLLATTHAPGSRSEWAGIDLSRVVQTVRTENEAEPVVEQSPVNTPQPQSIGKRNTVSADSSQLFKMLLVFLFQNMMK